MSWPGRGQDAQGRGLDALGAEGRSGPQRPRAVAAQRTALAGEMLQVAQVGERTTSLQPCAEQPRLGLSIHNPIFPPHPLRTQKPPPPLEIWVSQLQPDFSQASAVGTQELCHQIPAPSDTLLPPPALRGPTGLGTLCSFSGTEGSQYFPNISS